MNKSLATNLIAIMLFSLGWMNHIPWLFEIGLFALAGAATNWLAVHMLFEKVPLLYGSGVITRRFSAFKTAINDLVMTQFFSQERLSQLINNGAIAHSLNDKLQTADLSPAFDSLVTTVEQSQFGTMLSMVGGTSALEPLREPFIEKLRVSLSQALAENTEALGQDNIIQLQDTIVKLVDTRLKELTPELVKQLVEDLIKEHLGWLVVWGGVFGGLFGLLSFVLR